MNEMAYTLKICQGKHIGQKCYVTIIFTKVYKIERTVISKRYVNPLSSWQFPYALQYYNFGVY